MSYRTGSKRVVANAWTDEARRKAAESRKAHAKGAAAAPTHTFHLVTPQGGLSISHTAMPYEDKKATDKLKLYATHMLGPGHKINYTDMTATSADGSRRIETRKGLHPIGEH